MDDFIVRAALAGVGLAVIGGPVGCFIVWRRMAYFGATLAHAALLGIALGFLFDVSPTVGIVAVCVAVSLLLAALQRQRQLASDTLMGILAHGALAAGLVVIGFTEGLRVDLLAYLFGDILAVTAADLLWIYAGGLVSLAVLAVLWRRLLCITVDEDLARVEGVPVEAVRLLFMVLIAVVIAVAMKIVGILLIISLLIIPAAAARRFAPTPEVMALGAVVAGVLSVAGGLGASLRWDVPAGPAIVTAATVLFLASLAVRTGRKRGAPIPPPARDS